MLQAEVVSCSCATTRQILRRVADRSREDEVGRVVDHVTRTRASRCRRSKDRAPRPEACRRRRTRSAGSKPGSTSVIVSSKGSKRFCTQARPSPRCRRPRKLGEVDLHADDAGVVDARVVDRVVLDRAAAGAAVEEEYGRGSVEAARPGRRAWDVDVGVAECRLFTARGEGQREQRDRQRTHGGHGGGRSQHHSGHR